MALTEKGLAVFNQLKELEAQGTLVTRKKLAEIMGVKVTSVNGSVRGLQNKGLVESVEEEIVEMVDDKEVTKTIKLIKLTDKAATFDPMADEPKAE